MDAGVKMDHFYKFCAIRASIVKAVIPMWPEDEQGIKKFAEEVTGNVTRLYNTAEVWLSRAEGLDSTDLTKICIDLLNDTAFLKAVLDDGALKLESYLELLEKLSETGFSCLRSDVRKEIAGILCSKENVRKYILDDGEDSSYYKHLGLDKKILSLIKSLDPEYDVTDIFRPIAAKIIRDTKVKDEDDLFKVSGFSCAWNFIDGYSKYLFPGGVLNEEKFDEIFSFFHKNFFREKVLNNDCFKRLPEFFQKIVILRQIGDYRKLLPEFGIDADEFKEDLKKGVYRFLSDLNRIVKSGGTPSDCCAGYLCWPPTYYLVASVFHSSISFLKRYYGCWKALKPMLVIFRSLKEQAYHMGLQRYNMRYYAWDFVSENITNFLGSMEESETEKLCEKWFEYLGKQLHSADDFEVKKRTENPERVPEKFRSGYDIKVIEPHPVWREAYCEAAGDLGVNLGFDKCRIFNRLKKEDIDENVRKAAGKTLERVEKIREKFDSASRKRALLNAWWWYRVAHLRSLGIDFDWNEAQERRRKEVTFYYRKDFF